MMMLLANYPKTSLTESTQPKPKMGFSIAELVGDETPSPKKLEVCTSNSTIPMTIESETPYIDPKLPIEDHRNAQSRFLGASITESSSRDSGLDTYCYPHPAEYPSLYSRYDTIADSHVRLPTHLSMMNRELHHLYHPWHPMGILRQKMHSANAFLFHPFRKPKRIRTAFAPTQLLQLEHAFEKNHYVVGSERRELAQALNLSETQVKVWFQNRRTKYKRQKQDDQEEGKSTDFSESEVQSSSSEDEMSSPGPSETRQSQSSCGSANFWNPLCSSSATVSSNISTFET